MDANNDNSNKNKNRGSLRIKLAKRKKQCQAYAVWKMYRDKRMLELKRQSRSLTIANYMDTMKITSVTHEVIIENDGWMPRFNNYAIERLCEGHPENPPLTHLKLLGVTDKPFSKKRYRYGSKPFKF